MSELLAPAGGAEALRAAVENGADAVYLGLRGFNARRGAENFDACELRAAVRHCHLRGVRVHVTLNTLVYDSELARLEESVAAVAEAGADAVIVQDLGVAATVRAMAPGLSLHASTQMAVHNRQGVAFLRAHGFARAVLAREMPLAEIEKCADLGVELEAFCHGALCVSCSGQCLFSSLVGARSGNRGMCAQPCRLPYRLGEKRGYLLSPRDLMLVDDLCALRRAGVTSFKIEGRLKRPEYVAVVTDIYRRALDGGEVAKADREALLQIFNRGGFSRGYLRDMNDAALMGHERPNHQGLPVAENSVLLRRVTGADALVERRPGAEDVPVRLSGAAGERIARRGKIFRLVDAGQMRLARESYARERRQTPAAARLALRVGQPMRLEVAAGGAVFCAEGESVARAQKRPLDPDRVREQLCKTGGSPFAFAGIILDADPDAFVALSQLNALRRAALEGLAERLLAGDPKPVARAACPAAGGEATPARPPRPVARGADAEGRGRIGQPNCPPRLIARAADAEVLLRALDAGADEIAFDPDDLRPEALDAFAASVGERKFCLVLPQVADAETLAAVHRWAEQNAARILATYRSNPAHLAMSWPGEARGDFGLNLLNARAAKEAGLFCYMPSLEMNARAMAEMPGELEVLLWGRVPLMRLRHCPLRAAWALPGTHAACRRCDRNARPGESVPSDLRDPAGRLAADGAPVRLNGLCLIDRRGAAFPLHRVASQEGCVVEVLNSVPVFLPARRDLRLPPGVRKGTLLLRPGEMVEAIVGACRAYLTGETVDLAAFANMPTTGGHIVSGVK